LLHDEAVCYSLLSASFLEILDKGFAEAKSKYRFLVPGFNLFHNCSDYFLIQGLSPFPSECISYRNTNCITIINALRYNSFVVPKEKRVGAYLRVSTSDQTTEIQKSEISEFLLARGWKDVRFYQDTATGTNGNRPEFKRLLHDCRQRKLDLVICWKLDRFFRSLKDLVTTLQELTDLGVEFVSLRDSIDLSTSSGRLMTHLLGAFGEFEASLIRERVRAGLRNARAKGKRLGRPLKADITHILRLRGGGLTIREIATTLSISKSAVHGALIRVRKTPNKTWQNPQ
jgi:putative DNA-invertase from lambdoid prophage Rac